MDIGMGMSLTNNPPSRKSGSFINPEYAKLLFHTDSAIVDDSYYDLAPTLVGTPTISATQKVFGAGSLHKAASEAIEFPASDTWRIADGIPFQVSFRLYRETSHQYAAFLFGNHGWATGGFHFRMQDTTVRITSNGSDRVTWTHTIALNTWEAHRITYDGTSYRWYVDGILLPEGDQTSGAILDASTVLAVGNRTGVGNQGDGFPGYMDEILWEKHPDLVVTTGLTYSVEPEPFQFDTTPAMSPTNPFSMTQLQLHLDSDFSDSSTNNRSPTLYGTPTIDTSEKVFGAGSMLCGLAKAVKYPADPIWRLTDSTPWQISFRWFRDSSATTNVHMFATRNPSTFGANGYNIRAVDYLGTPRIDILDPGGVRAEWIYTPPPDVWTAYRLNYDGVGLVRLYANGVLLGIRELVPINSSPQALYVANVITLDRGIVGNLDEVKWEKHADLEITTSPAYILETSAFPDL